VPASWLNGSNPSFWVNLMSHEPEAGSPQTMNDTFSCLRPGILVNGTKLPPQNVTVEADSLMFNSSFGHIGADAMCLHADDTRTTKFEGLELRENVVVT